MVDLFKNVLKDDENVRCFVIKGEGKAFSAGHNLKEMTFNEGRKYHEEIFKRCNSLMDVIVKSPLPVIAQVDGVAAAAGCQLVAMVDISVATQNSSFSVPGSGVGLFCSTPGIPLARAVPRKISSYMLLTGT
jgi:enoyl-CoA hydratase/carnithine racemase